MGLYEWAWGVYEYLCFLIGGIIVAINEANPYTRVKRKYFKKLPSVRIITSSYVLFLVKRFPDHLFLANSISKAHGNER